MIYRVILELLLKVKDAIMKTRLSPRGQRPIVCIDEAQVSWHSKHTSLCKLNHQRTKAISMFREVVKDQNGFLRSG